MSIPITALVIGGAVAGTATSAYGSVKQGNAAYTSGMYQAQVAERNKQIAEMNAAEVIANAAVEEQQLRRATASERGQSRAALAGMGQLLDAGTAGVIEQDIAQIGAEDVVALRHQAEREALNFTIQGMNEATSSQMLRSQAKSARTAGLLSGFGTLLSGASKAGYTYQTMKGGT